MDIQRGEVMSNVVPSTAGLAARPSSGFHWGEFRQETLALTRRLFIQLKRRPTSLMLGILQPLMFLILFGAAFRNAPGSLFGSAENYTQFLAAGVIIFTAFGSALNAGLPIVFDREFGFFNRLLVAPLVSRLSIVVASAFYIVLQSLIQTIVVLGASFLLGAHFAGGPVGLLIVALVVLLLVVGFTALSLALAFVVPGHIEILGILLVINLPLLFASTALAPLNFMPLWLQWIATLNPLTWAIEPVRYLFINPAWSWNGAMILAPWGPFSLEGALFALVGFNILAFLLVSRVLKQALG